MRSPVTAGPRLLLGVALTALLPVLGGVPISIGAAQASAASSSACSLPLTHDTYAGFHVGVPAGWSVSSFNDTIAVTKDPSSSEMAVLYPALMTGNVTPASLYASYSRYLEKTATAAHNQLSFRLTSKPGQLPQAVITGRAGTVAVQGRAMITTLRYPTAVAASELVFSAYWAPTARLSADNAMLSAIGRCYGPEAGTIYQVFHDQVFAFALPEGWKVLDEGQDNVDLIDAAGHSYAGYLLTLLPTSEAGNTPRSLLHAVFARMHVQITRFISSSASAPQQTATGGISGGEVDEFLGQYGGTAIHGLVYVTSSVGGSVTSGVLRMSFTRSDQWNGVNSGLIKVMTSIQHSMVQDEEQWAQLTRQWRQFDQTTQQFDDILNGVQEVRDPTTGQLYAAPYDTYEAAGPNGGGYYLQEGGFQQELQPVN